MLKDNIKAARKSKGLSQEELAIKLHAVRQTISKWERGLSVPDADMLISMSEIFDLPVSTLLGENIPETPVDNLKAISEKLETINLQLSEKRKTQRRIIQWSLISLALVVIIISIILLVLASPYSNWDYSDTETAVLGTAVHSFEWLFIRIAPIILIICLTGIILLRKKDQNRDPFDGRYIDI